jgi:hypothetical protein
MSGIIAQNSGRHTGLVKTSSGGGVWNLLKTLTASGDSDLSFVDGTDGVDFSSYDEHVFKFININPADDGEEFSFNLSTDGGSNYNVTKTSTFIEIYHFENDGSAGMGYGSSHDLAQGTGFQKLTSNQGNLSDESGSGELKLFGLNSTTFIKHYISDMNSVYFTEYQQQDKCAGYGNTTSAVDAVQFAFTGGSNFDGTISLYGIS